MLTPDDRWPASPEKVDVNHPPDKINFTALASVIQRTTLDLQYTHLGRGKMSIDGRYRQFDTPILQFSTRVRRLNPTNTVSPSKTGNHEYVTASCRRLVITSDRVHPDIAISGVLQ